MHHRFTILLLGVTLAVPTLRAADPTPTRKWTATSGHTAEGAATRLADGNVEIRTATGTTIKLALQKLIPEDQTYLKDHFQPAKKESPSPAATPALEALPHPPGKMVQSVPCGSTSYNLIIPETLRQGRPAPLLIISSPVKGAYDDLNKQLPILNLLGWVAITPRVSNNSNPLEKNHEFAKACADHAIETLPIDRDRFITNGASGGGTMTVVNGSKLKAAGVMPIIAPIYPGYTIGKDVPMLFFTGATDWSRFHIAQSLKQALS